MGIAHDEYDISGTVPERLIVDSLGGVVSTPDSALLKSLQKVLSSGLATFVKAIRGFDLAGFSIKVYVTPESSEAASPMQCRVQLTFLGRTHRGINSESVHRAYMDVSPNSESPRVERTGVAKSKP